jgi:hypothetical protein
MSRGYGGGTPDSSAAASRELPTGTKPDGGGIGRVEAEWKQQREKPVPGVPQVLVRPLQQSPHETAPATTGQRMPSATSPRKSHAGQRPRRILSFIAQARGQDEPDSGPPRPPEARAVSRSERVLH